jgi:hypothetical protein
MKHIKIQIDRGLEFEKIINQDIRNKIHTISGVLKMFVRFFFYLFIFI